MVNFTNICFSLKKIVGCFNITIVLSKTHKQCCESGSGMGKKSGMYIPDHISESVETIFGVKILKFFDADAGSGSGNLFSPGSGIRNGTNADPQSRKNIPDSLSRIRNTTHKLSLILNLRFFKEKYSSRVINTLTWMLWFRNDAQAGPHGELQHLGAGAYPPLPDPGLQGLRQ